MAWRGKHELWLRTHHFDTPGLQLAYDAAFDAMLATLDRRDRLDRAIEAMAADSVFTPVVRRLGCVRGISTLTALRAGCRDRRLASAHRPVYRRLPGVGAHRPFIGCQPLARRSYQDRQQPRPPAAHRVGLTSPAPVSAGAKGAATLGRGFAGGPGARTSSQSATTCPLGQLRRTQETLRGHQRRDRARTSRLVLVVGRARRLTPGATNVQMMTTVCRQASGSDPRPDYEQSPCSTTDHARG
jgi:hypothetical protein